MNQYIKIEKNGQLGSGSYGVVYKARHFPTGKLVAMKKIKASLDEEGIPNRTLREIAILKQLDHPNIIRLQDVIVSEERLYLVFEYVDYDLKKLMDLQLGRMPMRDIKSFSHQLITGLHFCHTRGVLHRDLKPQNILITHDNRLKIADFGISRAVVPPLPTLSSEVITLWYRPPEVLLGSTKYSPAVDMWGVGAVIAEMMMKKPILPGDCQVDQLLKIFRQFGTPDETSWPGVTSLQDWNTHFPRWPPLFLGNLIPHCDERGIDLLEQLFTLDPRSRLTSREALDHVYFRDCAPPSPRLTFDETSSSSSRDCEPHHGAVRWSDAITCPPAVLAEIRRGCDGLLSTAPVPRGPSTVPIKPVKITREVKNLQEKLSENLTAPVGTRAERRKRADASTTSITAAAAVDKQPVKRIATRTVTQSM